MKRFLLPLPRFAGLVTLAISILATSALAGPPLICHPFDIGSAKSLPWTGSNWNLSGNEGYDTANLVSDTLQLLTPDTPVIVRMETLRRATLYARKDPRAAKELLTRLHARATAAASTKPGALAWFDVGYLVETYGQWFTKDQNPGNGLDGYGFIKKALGLQSQIPGGDDQEMEFAAALVTLRHPGPDHVKHVQKAIAGAQGDALLSRNLALHFLGNPNRTVAQALAETTGGGNQ
jgi:hypothetical protein